MGLSQDPEKRERQMANLRKGWEKHAERLQGPKPEPTAETKPRAVKPALEVMDYEQQPKEQPAAKPKRKPRQQPSRRRQPARKPEARPEPAPEPRRERSGGGGFWDGFLGR